MSGVQPDQTLKTVVLFSGHMIDAADRETPRFPPESEPLAAAAIEDALSKTGVRRGDLAICGGACGGDLLFAEACLAREMRLEIYIPFEETVFLADSVDFAGGTWRDRYFAIKSRALLHVMPDELGPLQKGASAYELNNQWMLEKAARFGSERIAFICLWNGQWGDGTGGAKHLMDELRLITKQVYWLDTRQLWD